MDRLSQKRMDTTLMRPYDGSDLVEYYHTMRDEELDAEMIQRIINSDEEDDLLNDTSSFDDEYSTNIVEFDNAIRQQYEVAWSLINIADPSETSLSGADATTLFFELLDNYDEYLISRQAIGVLGNIISYGDITRIQAFLDSGIIPRILPVISGNDANVQATALRTIEKLLSGTDMQIEKMIVEYNLLKYFWKFLDHSNINVRRGSLAVLCNVVSIGSELQVHSLIKCDLLPIILENLNSSDNSFQQLASDAICNLTYRGNKEIVFELIHSQAVQKLSNAIKSTDKKIINNSLDSLYNVYKLAGPNHDGYVVSIIKEMGCIKVLNNLRNNRVSDVAVEMMGKFDDIAEPEIVQT